MGPFQANHISMPHAKAHIVTWVIAGDHWKTNYHPAAHGEKTFPFQTLKVAFLKIAFDILLEGNSRIIHQVNLRSSEVT